MDLKMVKPAENFQKTFENEIAPEPEIITMEDEDEVMKVNLNKIKYHFHFHELMI